MSNQYSKKYTEPDSKIACAKIIDAYKLFLPAKILTRSAILLIKASVLEVSILSIDLAASIVFKTGPA